MDTNIDLPQESRAKSKSRWLHSFYVAGIITLSLFLTFGSQHGAEETIEEIAVLNNIPLPFTPSVENRTADPDFTLGDCTNIEFNAILLIERSERLLRQYDPEDIAALRRGAKLYLSNISAMARSRPGAKAHVIIGAYGTYNVWQNLPTSRAASGRWTPAAKNQINIADPAVLQTQLEVIDDIYRNFSPSPVPAYSGSDVERGYLGGEPSRANVEHFRESNLDDALVQAARETSRWVDGAVSVGNHDDIDLVMTLTSGLPNVNNGREKFPSQADIFRDTPSLPDPNFWIGPWSKLGEDDLYRARQSVSRLRTGNALTSYVDTNDNGAPHSDMVHGAFAGERPPVRVFGQTLIPNANVFPVVSRMTYMFGWEWADYNSTPPSAAMGAQAIEDSHRHWDKTIGFIEENELLQDMNLAFKDFPCPVDNTVIRPDVRVTIPDPGPIYEGGDSVTINIKVRNHGDENPETNFPIVNMDVLLGADPDPKPREIPTQFETTTHDDECPYSIPDWFPIPAMPCHYTKDIAHGKKYEGGTLIGTIDHLEPGEEVEIPYTITIPIGGIDEISSLFDAYLNGQMLYDPVSQTALNSPEPASGPDERNGGYFWIGESRPLTIYGMLWPT